MNQQYDTLLKAVGAMRGVADTIHTDRNAMTDFVGYLSQNGAEISKFGKATDEVCEYMNKYDFVKGYQFESMQKKLELLHPLRLKLAKMGEEAKKLFVYPDRYDSRKSIEICRNLALTCREKMSLAEITKVSEIVDSNTQKLIEIQQLFERDGAVLRQINSLIDADSLVLRKFKACYDELKKYVSEFPHTGQDDLSVVKSRIGMLKQLDVLNVNVDKTVDTIRSCCDRYDKNTVVANYSSIVHAMTTSMLFAGVKEIENQLKDIIARVCAVNAAFEKEKNELRSLQYAMQSRSPGVWKEDNERLLTMVTSILNKDSRKETFDLNRLKTSFSNAKLKRTDDIDAKVNQYPWLHKRKIYRELHDVLISKYIASGEYDAAIDKLRKKRIKRIVLWCIPVIGWIFLMNMKNEMI